MPGNNGDRIRVEPQFYVLPPILSGDRLQHVLVRLDGNLQVRARGRVARARKVAVVEARPAQGLKTARLRTRFRWASTDEDDTLVLTSGRPRQPEGGGSLTAP